MINSRVIDDDLLGIARRIKEIDSGYFVVFNYIKKRYELHHSEQKGSSYALTFPFDRLDARAVEYTRQTRCERIYSIEREIEKSNQKLK